MIKKGTYWVRLGTFNSKRKAGQIICQSEDTSKLIKWKEKGVLDTASYSYRWREATDIEIEAYQKGVRNIHEIHFPTSGKVKTSSKRFYDAFIELLRNTYELEPISNTEFSFIEEGYVAWNDRYFWTCRVSAKKEYESHFLINNFLNIKEKTNVSKANISSKKKHEPRGNPKGSAYKRTSSQLTAVGSRPDGNRICIKRCNRRSRTVKVTGNPGLQCYS